MYLCLALYVQFSNTLQKQKCINILKETIIMPIIPVPDVQILLIKLKMAG
jgi:hypothetical protein